MPLALGTAVFAISAALWPRGAPILMAWDRLAGRRSQQWLDDGRPARISTAIAAANFAGRTVAVAGGLDAPLMRAGVLVLCAALVAEVVIGSCLPCEVIVWAAHGACPLRPADRRHDMSPPERLLIALGGSCGRRPHPGSSSGVPWDGSKSGSWGWTPRWADHRHRPVLHPLHEPSQPTRSAGPRCPRPRRRHQPVVAHEQRHQDRTEPPCRRRRRRGRRPRAPRLLRRPSPGPRTHRQRSQTKRNRNNSGDIALRSGED